MTQQDFASWLQAQLHSRDMDQSELARRATAIGYPIAPNTISRIINGDREAGADACISIAAGLGVSREEVFRARGWLLREPELIIEPDADPRLVKIVRNLRRLRGHLYDRALSGVDALITSFLEAQE